MGAALFSSVYLTIPVRTSDTTTYSRVQMASDPRMLMGMSRWGLRVSSAVVATTSKPMKAKSGLDLDRPGGDEQEVPGRRVLL
jgi:hypothetical protein